MEVSNQALLSVEDVNRIHKAISAIAKTLNETKGKLSEVERVAPEYFSSAAAQIEMIQQSLTAASQEISASTSNELTAQRKKLEKLEAKINKDVNQINSVIKTVQNSIRIAKDGSDGKDGSNGSNGQDGVGIKSAKIVGYNLILTFTDGTKKDVGRVVPEPDIGRGKRGAAGMSAYESALAGGYTGTLEDFYTQLATGGGGTWGTIDGTLSDQTDLQTALDDKQDALVSATNIKTINGASVLGSGNLVISGSGVGDMVAAVYDPTSKAADAFSTDNHVDGTTNKVYTATEKSKLNGIEASANNYTHPATHSADIITDGTTNKAYTATEKTKLSGIATGAEVNVQSDWNAASGDALILNKPTIPTALSDLSDDATHRLVSDTEKSTWNGKQDALVSATNIKTINGTTILGSGDLTVSGSMTYPGSGIAVSTGSAWGASLTAPTGAIVGISDTQTLTNKTLTSPKINENVALTSTATELNVLDGITATTAELNILDGVTLTATQINDLVKKSMTIAVSDESTAITTGTAKITFRAPHAMTLYQIPRASLSTASSSGAPAIDINVGGTSIFSTTLTIDATEKTSTTAATAAVMTSSEVSVSDDAEITIDIDTAGTGAKGLKVTLYYRRA